MSDTETEPTAEVRALGLLELPALDGLTESQVRGFTCAFDGTERPLLKEEAVALGPRRKGRLDGAFDWHPRGCKGHVSNAALDALFEHIKDGCEECVPEEKPVRGAACDVAIVLRRLALRRGLL